jgi:hypothetical protein
MQVYQLTSIWSVEMQSPSAQPGDEQLDGASGEFLIPDLCAPRAVVVMVLLAELMVLVYALAAIQLGFIGHLITVYAVGCSC